MLQVDCFNILKTNNCMQQNKSSFIVLYNLENSKLKTMQDLDVLKYKKVHDHQYGALSCFRLVHDVGATVAVLVTGEGDSPLLHLTRICVQLSD